MKIARTAGLALVFLLFWGAASRAADVGLLSSVAGEVMVAAAPGGPWNRASLMQTVADGGSVKVAAGGNAVVVLFQGGARYQLASGSVTAISAAAVRGVSGPAPGVLPALQIRQAKLLENSRVAAGRAASTVLRGGTAHIELGGLSATSILDDHPDFKWEATPGAISYKVRLWDDQDQLIWQGETAQIELALPADGPALKPDLDYLWNVTATVNDTLYKGEGIFRILPVDKKQAVQDELAALGGIDDTAVLGVLRAEVYGRYELWDDAIGTYEDLAGKFPDSAPIHAALASLLSGQAREGESRREADAAKALAAAPDPGNAK